MNLKIARTMCTAINSKVPPAVQNPKVIKTRCVEPTYGNRALKTEPRTVWGV